VSTPQSQNISIPDLRSELKGEVIGPDDAGYDEARQPPGLRPGAQRVSTPTPSERGRVTGLGDTGTVGIGGITLGGGIGFLARKYGLTIDDLLAAEVVTADGEIVQASEESEPRSLLNDPRRRGQLRRRQPPPAAVARDLGDRRRNTDFAGHPGGDHRIYRGGHGRP